MREKYYENKLVNLNAHFGENVVSKFIIANKRNISSLNTVKDEHINGDAMKLNIHQIQFKTNEALNCSHVVSVLLSLSALIKLLSMYTDSQKNDIMQKVNLMTSEIKIKYVNFECNYKGNFFGVLFNDVKILTLPSYTITSKKVKNQKEESIEDKTMITVKEIVVYIKTAEFIAKSLSVITTNLSKQLKIYNKNNKKISSKVCGGISIVDVRLKSLLLAYKRGKRYMNLFVSPALNYTIIDNNNFSFSLTLKKEMVENVETSNLNAEIEPIGIYLHGKTITKVVKEFNSLLSLNETYDITKVLTKPEKYVFHNSKKLNSLPLSIGIKVKEAFADFLKKKSKRGSIELKSISINNNNNNTIHEGVIMETYIKSENSIYTDLIIPLEDKPFIVFFAFNTIENILKFKTDNVQVIIMIKFIEEISAIFSYINTQISQPSEVKPLEENKQSKLKVVVNFTNSAIIFPKSSVDEEKIQIEFQMAELNTIGNEQVD